MFSHHCIRKQDLCPLFRPPPEHTDYGGTLAHNPQDIVAEHCHPTEVILPLGLREQSLHPRDQVGSHEAEAEKQVGEALGGLEGGVSEELALVVVHQGCEHPAEEHECEGHGDLQELQEQDGHWFF